MKKKMNELQEKIKIRNICEFEILSYKDFELKIIGSFDFAYYHNVEINFHGVSFILCSTKFRRAKIRFATGEERDLLLNEHIINYMEDDEILICFELNDGGDKYYILAEGFDYVFEEVLYYKKENLEEGQRIAEWVK
jgi:hypothetical protein